MEEEYKDLAGVCACVFESWGLVSREEGAGRRGDGSGRRQVTDSVSTLGARAGRAGSHGGQKGRQTDGITSPALLLPGGVFMVCGFACALPASDAAAQSTFMFWALGTLSGPRGMNGTLCPSVPPGKVCGGRAPRQHTVFLTSPDQVWLWATRDGKVCVSPVHPLSESPEMNVSSWAGPPPGPVCSHHPLPRPPPPYPHSLLTQSVALQVMQLPHLHKT